MKLRTTAAALAALVALGGLAPPAGATGAECTPIMPSQPHSTPAKSGPWQYRHSDVWLYGDSITYQTYQDLRHDTTHHRIAVDALWGRGTSSAVTALGRNVHHFNRHLPDVVVMATGTNDLRDLPAFAHQVQLARAVLPKRIRLLWVNVYVTTTSTYNGADRVLANTPGVEVLHWSSVNLGTTEPLLVDGIHVNSPGCAAHNALIRHAL